MSDDSDSRNPFVAAAARRRRGRNPFAEPEPEELPEPEFFAKQTRFLRGAGPSAGVVDDPLHPLPGGSASDFFADPTTRSVQGAAGAGTGIPERDLGPEATKPFDSPFIEGVAQFGASLGRNALAPFLDPEQPEGFDEQLAAVIRAPTLAFAPITGPLGALEEATAVAEETGSGTGVLPKVIGAPARGVTKAFEAFSENVAQPVGELTGSETVEELVNLSPIAAGVGLRRAAPRIKARIQRGAVDRVTLADIPVEGRGPVVGEVSPGRFSARLERAVKAGEITAAEAAASKTLTPKLPGKSAGQAIASTRAAMAQAPKSVPGRIRATWEKGFDRTLGAAGKIVPEPVKHIARQWFIWGPDLIDPAFAQAINEGFGGRQFAKVQTVIAARRLEKATRKLPEGVRDNISRYMNSEADSLPAGLNAKVRNAVNSMIAEIQGTRADLMERGLLSEEAAFEYPRFLTRLFRMKDDARAAGSFARIPEQHFRQDAYGIILNLDEAATRGVAGDIPTRYLNQAGKRTLVKFETPELRAQFLEALKASEHSGPKGGLKKVVSDQFNPLSAELRELLGEVTDPTELSAVTLLRARLMTTSYDMLAKIRRMGGEKGWLSGEELTPQQRRNQRPPDGFVLMENKRMGPMRDTWVRKDIAEQLAGDFGLLNDKGGFRALKDFNEGFTQEWKATHTVFNPGTHIRNAVSVPQQMIALDIHPLNPRSWGFYRDAARIIVDAELRGRLSPEYENAVRRGVTGVNFAEAEIDLYTNIMGGRETMGRKLGRVAANPLWVFDLAKDGSRMKAAGRGLRRAELRVGQVYNLPESVMRLAAYLKKINEGIAPDAAAAFVDRFGVNYRKVGPAIRAARKTPIISPFVTFAAETKRVMFNTAKAHPLRAAQMMMMWYAIREGVAATFGSDVNDEETAGLKDFSGSQSVAVGRDENGDPVTWDTRSWDVIGEMLDLPDLDADLLDRDGVITYLAELAGGDSQPGLDVLRAATTGRDEFGRKIISPLNEGDPLRAAGDVVKFGAKITQHPIVGRKIPKIVAASEGRQHSKREPVAPVLDAVLDAATGFNKHRYNPRMAQQYLNRVLAAKRSELQRTARKALREAVTDEERTEIRGRFQARQAELLQQFGPRIDLQREAVRSREGP